MHFSKKSGRLSSEGPDVLAFGSHCSAKFQPILNCFIPKFKLKYEDSENVKTDCADSHFQITSNQTEKVFFLGHQVLLYVVYSLPCLLFCHMI